MAAHRLAAAAAATAAAYCLWKLVVRPAYRWHIGRSIVRSWPHGVEVRTSRLRGAGLGLFARRDFAPGERLGAYHGRVLSLLQAHLLENRDYLMGGFGVNTHVDARFAMSSEGRYVNDNFDPACLNAKFVKDKAEKKAQLVATRTIRKGEEIYASYGEHYWRARGIDPRTGGPLPPTTK
ncbi:hypothetical protein AB1Y20_005201 [Prymnesium parvum]|uniref:SET domain-containing protein n=1 Tax=Prymnesium parvum TaxID=97485 RepID=A0AB34J564_PRYPA